MSKLIRHIILFILPVLIILVLLPVDTRLKYTGLKDDCFNHGIWIHDRIFENPEAVDIAFLGSSKTINAINDQYITDQLQSLKAANFGYCRLGRNMHYALFNEILQTKNIHTLVVEVREEEDRYSHPVFPFIASSRDVLLAAPFFNRDIATDIWTHLTYKVETCQDKLYSQSQDVHTDLNNFGFTCHSDTASGEYLEEVKQKHSGKKKEQSDVNDFIYNTYPSAYLVRISNLCTKHNIRLIFLYHPSFGTNQKMPALADTYNKYGRLIMPPDEIMDDKNNWFDENHLNCAGAEKLSDWIIGELY